MRSPSSRLFPPNSCFGGVILAALICIGGFTGARAQDSVPSISIRDGNTYLAGAISVGGDISTIETKSFTCTPVQSFKKGDKVAAFVSEDQVWSVDTHPLQVGTSQVVFPILGIVKASGSFQTLLPGVLRVKIDIGAGEALRADGYEIVAKRAVSAGNSISVLIVEDALLSVEAAGAAGKGGGEKPWFVAFKDGAKSTARASAVETWRITRQRVSMSSDFDALNGATDICDAAQQRDSVNSTQQTSGENRRVVLGTGESSLWYGKEETYNNYLRFYLDGTVIGVSSPQTTGEIEGWFKAPYENSGKYFIAG
jgi:hypothetical protein